MWKKRNNEIKTLQDYFLNNLGKNNLNEVNDLFRRSYAGGYEIDYLDGAVDFIKQTDKDTPIVVCGDYDVDGITSTTILLQGLRWYGFKNVSFMIPKRFTEGFGLNVRMVDDIASVFADHKIHPLIITCDNGTSAHEAVLKAKTEYQMNVIVVDHHEPDHLDEKMVLPKADIIINPHVTCSPGNFDGYCGAGLSYKLMDKLLQNKTLSHRLLVFAAIGTICDMMEMKEENYVIVKNGLKLLPYSNVCTKGLYALLEECNLNHYVNASGVGFDLGPRLNSISRLNDEGAKIAVGYLLEDRDYEQARSNAEMLSKINDERKALVKQSMEKVDQYLEDHEIQNNALLFYFPEIPEGIIGIVAGEIVKRCGLPAIVFTDTNNKKYLKGSARSIAGYNMIGHLREVSTLFTAVGGHEGAAGMTLPRDNYDELKCFLDMEEITPQEEQKVYDVEITPKQVVQTISEMKKFEPFANGNPVPCFKVNHFTTLDRYHENKYIQMIGKDKRTVRMYGRDFTVVGFHMEQRFCDSDVPHEMNLYGKLDENYFNNKVIPQVRLEDFDNFQ